MGTKCDAQAMMWITRITDDGLVLWIGVCLDITFLFGYSAMITII